MVEVVEAPKLTLPGPSPLSLEPVQWEVITDPAQITPDSPIIGLTADQFAAWMRNESAIVEWVENAAWTLRAYEAAASD